MSWRRAVTLGVVPVLLLGGCKDEAPAGQAVEVLAGGGSDARAARNLDASLTGEPADLEIGDDGQISLLARVGTRAVIWRFGPGGVAHRIDLDPAVRQVRQLALAGDGTMYVSGRSPGRISQIFKISATGKATVVVGNGHAGFTPDGRSALSPSSAAGGIAVDGQGRLVYTEDVAYLEENHWRSLGVIRRVEANGRLTTIAGRSQRFRTAEEYTDAISAKGSPPPGARALGWPMAGSLQLGGLAIGEDGTMYTDVLRGVLGFAPDGTVRGVARRRDRHGAPVAERPFTREGDAADATPQFSDLNPSLSVDGGYVAMAVEVARETNTVNPPVAYRWVGNYTPGQTAIINAAMVTEGGSPNLQDVVRLILPDGSVTTAAWRVKTTAVREGWLYLLIQSDWKGAMLIGRIKLPT